MFGSAAKQYYVDIFKDTLEELAVCLNLQYRIRT